MTIAVRGPDGRILPGGRIPAVERFLAKICVDPVTGCWLWTGALNKWGYGNFAVEARKWTGAHRFAYETWVGPIPEGMDLDHRCRTRSCANPDHVEPVTRRQNTLRGDTRPAANVRKTHCPRGHPYDEANTLHLGRRRNCRICSNESSRRSKRNGRKFP